MHMSHGLSIDFDFSSIISKSKKRREDYVDINEETCQILVTDHFTGMQFSATRQSKLAHINVDDIDCPCM